MSTNEKYLEEQRAAQVERAAATQASMDTVAAWSNGMHRIFKGIWPKPYRFAALRRVAARMEAGTHGPTVRQDPNNPRGGIHTRKDNPRKRRGPGGGGKRKDGPRR